MTDNTHTNLVKNTPLNQGNRPQEKIHNGPEQRSP